MVTASVLEDWRFSIMEFGELCVTIPGILWTLQWCADSWAVGTLYRHCIITLKQVQGRYGWMMYSAAGLKLLFKTVYHSDGEYTTVCMVKMLDSSAK
ncbi:hypothetical protein M9458_024464, partial [Cirrhinus mrigala]